MITVLWHDEESNGYTDLIPEHWLSKVGRRIGETHEVRGPRGGISSAKCDVIVADKSVDLDYIPYATFNKRSGMLIGVIRLEFKDSHRVKVTSVLWKHGDGQFVAMPTTVGREELDPESDVDDLPKGEGRKKLVEHLRVERNAALRNAKRKSVLSTTGSLDCEACGFSFDKTYGEIGIGFCEIHHRRALSESGEVKTSLEDLAVLCSNCHRMIHRIFPMMSVEDFRLRIREA